MVCPRDLSQQCRDFLARPDIRLVELPHAEQIRRRKASEPGMNASDVCGEAVDHAAAPLGRCDLAGDVPADLVSGDFRRLRPCRAIALRVPEPPRSKAPGPCTPNEAVRHSVRALISGFLVVVIFALVTDGSDHDLSFADDSKHCDVSRRPERNHQLALKPISVSDATGERIRFKDSKLRANCRYGPPRQVPIAILQSGLDQEIFKTQ